MDRDGHKPNWSTDELEALGQGVSANTKSIKRKFSTGLGIGRLVNVLSYLRFSNFLNMKTILEIYMSDLLIK